MVEFNAIAPPSSAFSTHRKVWEPDGATSLPICLPRIHSRGGTGVLAFAADLPALVAAIGSGINAIMAAVDAFGPLVLYVGCGAGGRGERGQCEGNKGRGI